MWQNYFPHPCGDNRIVYVVYDQPHALKSLAAMFRAGHTFKLPAEFLKKHELTSAYVKLEHVYTLLKFQSKSLFKLSPYLTEDCLDPSHFQVPIFFINPRPGFNPVS